MAFISEERDRKEDRDNKTNAIIKKKKTDLSFVTFSVSAWKWLFLLWFNPHVCFRIPPRKGRQSGRAHLSPIRYRRTCYLSICCMWTFRHRGIVSQSLHCLAMSENLQIMAERSGSRDNKVTVHCVLFAFHPCRWIPRGFNAPVEARWGSDLCGEILLWWRGDVIAGGWPPPVSQPDVGCSRPSL